MSNFFENMDIIINKHRFVYLNHATAIVVSVLLEIS